MMTMEPGCERLEPQRNGMATMAGRTHQLRELSAALQKEAKVVAALRDALIEQRTALAADDAEAVNTASDAVGRILLVLEEVRSSRATVLAAIGGGEPVRIEQIEETLGISLPLPLEQARAELRRVGQEVAREVAVNRAVLRRAVETGEAFLQALFSSTLEPSPVYQPPDRGKEKEGGGGVFFDRVV
jgi:hypothetical protein